MDTKVRSGAPLPYRPKPIALQAKPASAAPPVYRPQQFTQAKLAAPPPVYRPVSMPPVTQRQTAVVKCFLAFTVHVAGERNDAFVNSADDERPLEGIVLRERLLKVCFDLPICRRRCLLCACAPIVPVISISKGMVVK